jgi:hypothetical protein
MSENKPFVVTMTPEQRAFVKEAAESANVSQSELGRKAVLAFAADLLQRPAPEATVSKPGAKNPFAAAAAAEGMTVKGYTRKLACQAAGLEFKPRKGDLIAAA